MKKTKRKPGPKPKPVAELAQRVPISMPAKMRRFLDEDIDNNSKFVQALIKNSQKYQNWKRREGQFI